MVAVDEHLVMFDYGRHTGPPARLNTDAAMALVG
jgi:hypothetical protein